jgi:hypothetical protein
VEGKQDKNLARLFSWLCYPRVRHVAGVQQQLHPITTKGEQTMSKTENTMTNAAHTPGPWDFDNYADHVSYFSDASKRKDDYDFRVEFPDDMPEAEAEANARLIAAAPELLEALKDTLRRCEGEGWSEPETRTIRAALDKATGS